LAALTPTTAFPIVGKKIGEAYVTAESATYWAFIVLKDKYH